MDIRILGPLQVGDPPVPLGGRTPRALLAMLVLARGRTVSREALIGGVWGEDVPDTVVKMIQVYVSQLRKVLPPGALVTRGAGYALEVAPERVDLHRAERAAADARTARAAGDDAGAAALLADALALWRGPALAEFEEPFAAAEAGRIEELRLAMTEERIAADLALGHAAAVVGDLEVLVAAHPLRERLRELLMTALYRCGRQGDALAVYADARAALDALGLEPSPSLRALEVRILRQDPALDPVPPAGSPAREPAAAGLVDRDPERERLGLLLGEALGGRARVAVVSGEAGLGKTSLVGAFTAEVAARHPGVRVAHGQCVEQSGAGEAYMPVLEALSRLCDEEPELTRLVEERAPMWLVQLPALVPQGSQEALAGRVRGVTPSRMLREGVDALVAIAGVRPLVLVVEDLHWSDASTVDLLAALARRADPARLLVIATLRLADAATAGHPAHDLVRELCPRGLVAEIPLRALDADGVRDCVARRLPGLALPDPVAADLLARSRGNPLYVEKAADAWVQDDCVRQEAGRWRVAVDGERLLAVVPDSLRALIRDRLAHVPSDARPLVEAAAVIGPEASAALVASAAGCALDEAEDALERLARAGLVIAARGAEAWPDGTIASRYGFTHDLCQEVLYDDLTAGRRARLHMRVAERLVSAYGHRVDEVAAAVATHFARAGDGARAVPHLLATARRAMSRQAHREALEAARTALDLAARMPAGAERDGLELSLQAIRGAAAVGVEGWGSAAAEEAFVRGCDLAEALGRDEELGWALHRLATLYEIRGDYPRAERLLERSLGVQGAHTTAELDVDSHELLACSLFHQGVFSRALSTAERALSMWDGRYENAGSAAYGDSPGVACTLWAALSLWFLGRTDEAAERAAAALDLAERLGSLHARVFAHAQLAVLACIRELPDEAVAHGEATLAGAVRGGYDYREAIGRIARGWGLAARGAHAEGVDEIRSGVRLSRAAGAHMDEAFYLGLLADACARAGRVDDALEALDDARAVVPRGGRFFWEAELHRLRGDLLLRCGRTGEAEESLRRAVRVAAVQGSPTLRARAEATLAHAVT